MDRLTEDINSALNRRRYVVGPALDLSKAFDLVQYDILIDTLIKIWQGGKLLQFFNNFITNRFNGVSIGLTHSDIVPQSCGLIQGSILTPILFNLYINDLANILRHPDDTVVY